MHKILFIILTEEKKILLKHTPQDLNKIFSYICDKSVYTHCNITAMNK